MHSPGTGSSKVFCSNLFKFLQIDVGLRPCLGGTHLDMQAVLKASGYLIKED
jgi:hypothetical protein